MKKTYTTRNKNKLIIIGGGISGLSLSSLMSQKGWEVTVVEKNSNLGGRARVLKENGFSFDMGPSWYLMPEVFEKFFSEFNKKVSDYYTLFRLDPKYSLYFSNGKRIDLSDSFKDNQKIYDRLEDNGGQKLIDYISSQKIFYELVTQDFLYRDLYGLDFIKINNFYNLIISYISNKFYKNWEDHISLFFKSDSVKKMLGFSSVFLGGSPKDTPAFYSILNYVDYEKGVWYPSGGIGKVVQALVDLAKEEGVKIITDHKVDKISIKNGVVDGVFIDGNYLMADIVISSADPVYTKNKLLDEKLRHDYEFGISSILLYIGINKKIKNINHHNIFFSNDWQKNFDEIKKDKLPEEPSFYVSVRSVTDKGVAPKGCEEIFVLIPTPSSLNISEKDVKNISDKVILKIEDNFKTKFVKNIIYKKIYTPKDFNNDYNSTNGNALGIKHTLKQSLWGRHTYKDDTYKNLFYVGQFTNPGVGVPMCLISSQNVSRIIGAPDEYFKNIFKDGSTTYYNSSLLFPKKIRNKINVLYAFVRKIDDIVDRAKPDREEFDKVVKDFYDSWSGVGRSKYPYVRSFVSLAKNEKIKLSWIEPFLNAMKSDFEKKIYINFTELEEYIHGSAEVVGLMMAKILKLPKKSYRYARLLGKSMQLINFIRDVKFDTQLGRNYLDIKPNSKKFEERVKYYVDLYLKIQNEAEKGFLYIPKRYLLPIKTASDMYKWTAKKIASDPKIILEKTVKPTKFQIFLSLVKNFITIKS